MDRRAYGFSLKILNIFFRGVINLLGKSFLNGLALSLAGWWNYYTIIAAKTPRRKGLSLTRFKLDPIEKFKIKVSYLFKKPHGFRLQVFSGNA